MDCGPKVNHESLQFSGYDQIPFLLRRVRINQNAWGRLSNNQLREIFNEVYCYRASLKNFTFFRTRHSVYHILTSGAFILFTLTWFGNPRMNNPIRSISQVAL